MWMRCEIGHPEYETTCKPSHVWNAYGAAHHHWRETDLVPRKAIFLQSPGRRRHNQKLRRFQIVNWQSGPLQRMPAGETDSACCGT
jgi:hypothetical protein